MGTRDPALAVHYAFHGQVKGVQVAALRICQGLPLAKLPNPPISNQVLPRSPWQLDKPHGLAIGKKITSSDVWRLERSEGTLGGLRNVLSSLFHTPAEPAAAAAELYRVDFVDELDRVHHRFEFYAADDNWAIWKAELRRTSLKMELWCGPRLVRKWDWLPIAPPFP